MKNMKMKKQIATLLTSLLLVLGLTMGCQAPLTNYNFNDFSKVEIGSAFEFEIQQSNSYSIGVTISESYIDIVDVSKEGDTLKVRLKPVSGNIPSHKVSITMPQLNDLAVSGASHGSISGFSSTKDLKITVSGASELTGDITSGDVDFNVSGASTIRLEGSASDMVSIVSGASRFNLNDFNVINADMTISGASSGTIKLDGRLDAIVSGASNLDYIGDPTIGTVDISGDSKLRKR